MLSEYGIYVSNIRSGSIAEKSGILPGDILLSVNSHKLRDPIDFMFYSADEMLDIVVKRNGRKTNVTVSRDNNMDFGIDFRPFKVKTCKNNCIFCFVKQLPKGLRNTLYIKDEDYRLSFLYGNYITLSNLSKEDKKRIVEQRLNPLYISVHSTNRATRNRLLGNPKAPDIMKELKFLTDNRLRLNIQIVLCPGYNDGKDLRKTLSNLYRFYPYVLSIAVVPVGLTSYRKLSIRPVEKKDAIDAINIIESFQRRFMKKHGNPIVYAADELYLKAGLPFPPLKKYGELHQIENGVGMVSLFMNQAKKVKLNKPVSTKNKYLTFTGTSFYPFLKRFIEKISEKEKINIDVVQVENNFFGKSITVAGLLTGRDIIKTVLDKTDGHKELLVPDVTLDGEDRFLDDVTLDVIEETLEIKTRKIQSTPQGLLNGIS